MKKAIFFISIATLLITSCGAGVSSEYNHQAPEVINDGLDVGTLDEANMDSALLGKAVDRIRAGDYGEIHSMLIFHDGKLVFEEYFPGRKYRFAGPYHLGSWVNWDHDKEHIVMSAGKSITSASIGIALEKGIIESVDQSIFDYLPNHQHLNTDGKDAITIEHLLTMTSGLAWDEWGHSYSSLENSLIRLIDVCDDQVACILEAPLVSEPGTDFVYSGGSMILLGEIIKNATGMDIEAFANENLFAPLEIDPIEWRRFDSGVVFASGEQYLTPREMVKFGVTFLDGGMWGGQQIVSEGWVEKSASPYPGPDNSWFNHFLRPIPPGDDTWGRRGYSYTWWTHEFSHKGQEIHAYWASGWGGQKIIVLPELNAVVVFTGGNFTGSDPTIKILKRYVLPAFD